MLREPGVASTEPVCVSGVFDGETITTNPLPQALGEVVMSRGVAIVKGVFKSRVDDLLALRHRVFEWASRIPPLAKVDPTVTGHCLQAGVSSHQQTPHVFHSYNFAQPSKLPPDLSAHLLRYYEPLTVFQNLLTGNSARLFQELPRLENFGDRIALHPHMIQYPLGGGFFGRHIHPLEPQRIGMIVALSRPGVDFGRGGTCFMVGDNVIDIEPHHEMGDIALFRFDIPHWVNPSDLADDFSWDLEAGRWSMVLPYS